MELFRRLADNFFFKIILAFVILTFVLFGVSGFLLGGDNNYVAKIGDETISYKDFIESSRGDREIIRSSTNSEEAAKYLESKAFKRDVLGRLINKRVSAILADEYGFIANQELILKKIINDKEFRNKSGGFDQALFDAFLKKHSLDEERYINIISNEIISAGVVQSFTIVAPVNKTKVLELANLDKEKRQVSVVEIKKDKIGKIVSPKTESLKKYYETNKENYRKKEIREVEVLAFSKEDLEKNFEPTEEEIKAKYEDNKDQFSSNEEREFLHIIFDKEEEGKEFIQALTKANTNKANISADFAKVAKDKLKKELSDIQLSKITKHGLLPSIAGRVFALKSGEVSEPLQSELGYHVFLTTNIIKSKPLSYAKAKESIALELRKTKKTNLLDTKIAQINDIILESNSLSQIVKQMDLKKEIIKAEFDIDGNSESGKKVKEIVNFVSIANDAFSLDADKISKIYYTKDYQGFYIFKVKKVVDSHYENFSDIKNIVKKDFIKNTKQETLLALANKVAEEIKANPAKAAKIAESNKATYRYKTVFDFANEETITKDVFSLKLGTSSKPVLGKDGNYKIVILRKIIPGEASSKEFAQKKVSAIKSLRRQILQKYDAAVSVRYPVSINEKVFNN